MTVKNFIGDKLSTQSLVLGKKFFKGVVIISVILLLTHQISSLEKLNSRELYNIQLILNVEKPTAQTYLEKKFQNTELEWKEICTLPRRVTINTNLRIFQYKLSHNILYLHEMLYKFGKKGLFLFACKNLKVQFTFFILAQKRTFSRGSYKILSKMY